MGFDILDEYSLLHMASGIIAFFFDISFTNWFLLHAAFEYLENTPNGVYFIDNYIWFWPGGKLQADSLSNSISDQFFAMLGWILAYYVKKMFKYKQVSQL